MTPVATIPADETAASEIRAEDRRYLNAADRLMLVGHDGMQSIGHPGFICQTQIRLIGRVDVGALRRAVEELARRHPVVTARLRRDDRQGPYWQPTGERAPLHEAQAAPGDKSAAWKEAQRLLEIPLNLENEAPLSFHLFHESDGNDLLMIRFSHALMDGKSPEWTLQVIDECFGDCVATPVTDDGVDEMDAYLHRFDRKQRGQSAWRVIKSQVRLPATPVTMAPVGQKDWLVAPMGLSVRTLDAATSDRLTQRVKRICGFANLTPAIVASIFRAIGRCTPHRTSKRTCYQTDCPLNLRPPGVRDPLFRNFMSFISLSARQSDLAERDEATRRLSAQMRDQIRRGFDLGNLQLMTIMSRYAPLLRSHIITRLKRRPFTLGFGFLGPVAQSLTRFCGRDVENVLTFNTSMSPPGVTIQANQFAGRINLMMTYTGAAVPEASANRLMDEIVHDLCA